MTVERAVRVGGLAVRVVGPEVAAKRGAVVLVHGMCLSGRVWGRWADVIAQRGIEAWCIDLRGHGDSEGRASVGAARIEDYAADVESVLDESGALALVGHDMGGLVSQVVAARRPLRGVALVGSVGPGLSGPGNLDLLRRELRPRYIQAIVRGKAWQPTDDDMRELACDKLGDDEKKALLGWVGPESGVAVREMVVTGVPVDETQIRCPVLVAATTFDRLTPPARQRAIASRYRADYVEFAQHSHLPMLEPGWERPAAVIGRWLEEAARLGDNKSSVARIAAARRAEASPPAPKVEIDKA
jgi:pimeloyl-ACP methyl ester carboxylesterase